MAVMHRSSFHRVSVAVAAIAIHACYTGPDVDCGYYGARLGADGGVVVGDPGGDGDGGAAGGGGCASGLTACSSDCVDVKSDKNNCGACGTVCPVVCANGACATSCPPPTTNCSGSCVDTQSSVANCGACGTRCEGGKVCTSGACSCGAQVSLSTQLQPLMTAECATTGCHKGNQAKADLDLTAGRSYAEMVGPRSTAAGCTSRLLVVPGSVEQSYFVNKLTGIGMCNGSAMPKSGGLAPAQVDLFRAWICNGAPNN